MTPLYGFPIYLTPTYSADVYYVIFSTLAQLLVNSPKLGVWTPMWNLDCSPSTNTETGPQYYYAIEAWARHLVRYSQIGVLGFWGIPFECHPKAEVWRYVTRTPQTPYYVADNKVQLAPLVRKLGFWPQHTATSYHLLFFANIRRSLAMVAIAWMSEKSFSDTQCRVLHVNRSGDIRSPLQVQTHAIRICDRLLFLVE